MRLALRGAGTWRALLIVLAAAVASTMLLVAAAVVRSRVDLDAVLDRQRQGDPTTLAPMMLSGDTRLGVFVGVLMVGVPLLVLAWQVVGLGVTTRRRRYAALRVAGATRRQVARWSAVEVGAPAVVGAIVGLPVFLGVQQVLRGPVLAGPYALLSRDSSVHVVDVLLTWVVVTGLGALGGVLATRSAAEDAWSVVRRAPVRTRPWGLVPLGFAVVTGLAGLRDEPWAGVWLFVSAVLLVLGVVGLSTWLAHRIARWAARQARRPATLIAARRLVAEPRVAALTGGSVAVVGLFVGVLAAFVPDARGVDSFDAGRGADVSAVATGLVLAVLIVSASFALHAAQTWLERRREVAAQVALGTERSVVESAQRREATLVALPLAGVGVVVGALAYSAAVVGYGRLTWLGVLGPVGALVLMLAVSWAAADVTSRLTRPLLRSAADPVSLRSG